MPRPAHPPSATPCPITAVRCSTTLEQNNSFYNKLTKGLFHFSNQHMPHLFCCTSFAAPHRYDPDTTAAVILTGADEEAEAAAEEVRTRFLHRNTSQQVCLC